MVGEYRIDSVLGRGAFGTVYKATQPVIGKLVAIKVLALRFSVDPEMVSRFGAEARAVNQIRHRNIIDIFSFGQLDDGRHYYVMELLDGDTLDVILDRVDRLPLVEALPILRAIARALDAAHGKGIAHRDLKAENVFVARDDDGAAFPKLLDFGIAKLLAPDDGLAHKTRTGTPVGTPYYMSPEQCKGRDVDHRTDLYALGVLAYRLLAGRFPFDADDAMSIMMMQLADTAVPPSSIVAELPSGIDEAIAWLMAKDPADRPATARDAIAALERAAARAGIAVAAPSTTWDVAIGPASGAVRTVPSRRPKRTWLAIACGVLVLAAGAMAFALLRVEPAADPAERPAPPPRIDPPATTAPVAHVEPAKPDVATSVIVTITGVPDGTDVSVAGLIVGAAPGPVQLPRGDVPLVLTFKRDGYLPRSRTVTPDRDQALRLVLDGKPVPARRPSKDDIIDPFGKAP